MRPLPRDSASLCGFSMAAHSVQSDIIFIPWSRHCFIAASARMGSGSQASHGGIDRTQLVSLRGQTHHRTLVE